MGSGEYQAAIAFYELARERLPDEAVPTNRLASAHRTLGTLLLEEDKCDEAQPHFDQAEALTKPLLADREALYACLERTSAPGEARIEALEGMVERGDSRTRTLSALMRLRLAEGRYEAAVSMREEMSKRHVLTPDDQRQLAMAFIKLGRLSDARADLEVAVQHHPGDALMRLKLGEIYEQAGDLPAATAVYQGLVKDFPRNPLIHQRLSSSLAKQGDLEGARRAADAARALRGHTRPPERDLRPLRKSRR